MRKIMLTVIIAVIAFSVNAQNFGLRAGADFASMKLKFDGDSMSESETGFYVGAFVEIEVSEKFNVRPEVNYVNIEELDQIQIPVLAQIGLSDNFDLVVGPNFGFLLDSAEDAKSFNLGADLGLAYGISENFSLEARYSLGLSNLIDDMGADISAKLSGFQVGVGYSF